MSKEETRLQMNKKLIMRLASTIALSVTCVPISASLLYSVDTDKYSNRIDCINKNDLK
jgi:hypothetical protein